MSIKLKKTCITILSVLLVFSAVISCAFFNKKQANASGTSANSIVEYNQSQYEENMVRPFWKSNVIYNEIVMPYSHQNTDGTIGSGQLLFTPIKIISVRDQTLGIEYAEGKDWVVDSISRKLYFPYGSAITCIDRDSNHVSNRGTAYPLTGGKYSYVGTFTDVSANGWNMNNYCDLGAGDITYTEGTMFLDHYLSVTYVYDTTELPALSFSKESPFTEYNPAGTSFFPNFIASLENAATSGLKEINYLGIGDSISAGCSATGGSFGGIAPNTPRYQELVCREIERIYGVKVNYYSIAVGGTTSDYPLLDSGVKVINGHDFGGGKQSFDEALAARDYQLCSIGYGMNDVGNNTPDTYRVNVAGILNKVITDSPDCAVMLINSFPRNPEHTIAIGHEGTLDTEYFNALEQIRAYGDPETNPDATNNGAYGRYAGGNVRVINMHATGDYMMKFQYTTEGASTKGSTSYNTYTGGAKSYLEISSTNVNHPNDFIHRIYAMNIMSALYDYPVETYTYPENTRETYVHHTGTKEFTYARDVNGWSNTLQDTSLGDLGANNGRFVYYDKADNSYIIRNTLGYAGPGESFFNANGNNTYFHITWGGHMVNYTPFDVTKDIIISYNYTPDATAISPLTCNAWYGLALFGSLKEAFIAGTSAWDTGIYNTKLYLRGANCDTDTGNADRSDINGRLSSTMSGQVSERFVPNEMDINNWSSYWYTLRISIGTTDTKVYMNDTLFATVAKTRADYANGVAYLSVATGGNMAFNFSISQDYNITYDLDGGSLETENPATYSFNSQTFTLNNPTKAGFNFAGWTGTGLTKASKNVNILNGSTGDRAYTATWVEKGKTYTDISVRQVYTHNDPNTVAGPALEVYFTGIYAGMLEQYSNHLSTMDIVYERGGVSKPIADFTYIAETGAFVMRLGTSLGQGFVNDYYYMEVGDIITFKAGSYITADGYDIFRIVSDIKYIITDASETNKTGCVPYRESEITVNNINVYDTTLRPGWGRPTLEFWFYGTDSSNWVTFDDYSATMDIVYTSGNEVKELVGFYYANSPFITYLGNTETFDPQVGDVITIKAGSYIWDGNTKFIITQDNYFKLVRGYNESEQKETFLAQAFVPSFTVSFANTGDSTINALTIEINQKATKPATDPTRTGYTFVGWFLGNAEYDFNTPITSDITLTAKWTAVDYAISYDLAGGNVNGTNLTKYNIESGDIILINPTKIGYTFTGWTGTGLSEPTINVMIVSGATGDRNFVATWTINTYEVTFVTNSSTAIEGQTVEYNGIVNRPNDPVKTGFTFGGWYNYQSEYDFNSAVTSDITLTAKWTIVSYTITYNLNGGEVDGTNKESYTIESGDITLINPTKEGYTFKGWTGTGLSEPTMNVTIESGSIGDREYIATWEVIEQCGGDVNPPEDGGDQTPDTDPEDTPKEPTSGCLSSVGGTFIVAVIVIVLASIVVLIKRKNDNA